MVFMFSNAILLSGLSSYGMIENFMGDAEVLYGSLNKLKSIINAKNFRSFGVDDNTLVRSLRRYTQEAREKTSTKTI